MTYLGRIWCQISGWMARSWCCEPISQWCGANASRALCAVRRRDSPSSHTRFTLCCIRIQHASYTRSRTGHENLAAIARAARKTKGSWEKCDRSIDSKHHGAFVSAPTLSGRVAVLFEREEQWHFNASNRACGLGLLFIGGLPR